MTKTKMKVIFFGTPDFVIPVLETLVKNFEVVGVVTTPDALVGRKQNLTPTPVAKYAEEYKIPVFKPEKLSDPNFKFQISNFKFDLAIVAAYGKIIPQSLLNIPKFGFLNLHPSLLPKYRGPSPIQAAILNGDKVSGVTIIKMDNQMDHGPIVTAKEFTLSEQDTFQTLSTKMFISGAKLLEEILPQYIDEKVTLRTQDDTKTTYCKLITKDSGYFDINNPPSPEILDRMIRAYYPWPTVWTKWRVQGTGDSRQEKIVKFLPIIRHPELDSGSINDKLLVQMEGKKAVSLKDFLNGYPNFPLKNL